MEVHLPSYNSCLRFLTNDLMLSTESQLCQHGQVQISSRCLAFHEYHGFAGLLVSITLDVEDLLDLDGAQRLYMDSWVMV